MAMICNPETFDTKVALGVGLREKAKCGFLCRPVVADGNVPIQFEAKLRNRRKHKKLNL